MRSLFTILGDGQTYAARVDRRLTLGLGDTVELAVAIAALHFFDPHTEAAITAAVDGSSRSHWPNCHASASTA